MTPAQENLLEIRKPGSNTRMRKTHPLAKSDPNITNYSDNESCALGRTGTWRQPAMANMAKSKPPKNWLW